MEQGPWEPALLARRGWTQRFTACEPRLSEAVEVYEAAGFEVRLVLLPKRPGSTGRTSDPRGRHDDGNCRVCYDGDEARYRIIFTRPSQVPDPRDDLF